MKVSKFYFPLLAAAMLASCSSENDPVNKDVENGNGELRYLAVNICNPAGATRADEFKDGEDAESAVNNALFVIADNSGIVKAAVTSDDLTKIGSDAAHTIEYIAKAVLVVNDVDDRTPYYQMVTIVNYTDDMKNLVLNSDGTVKQNVNISTFTGACDAYGQDKGFIMTNSVYTDNKGAQKIPVEQFRHTDKEAIGAPVNVYVERVVAKVKTSAIGKNNGASKPLGTATTDTKFTISVDGIDLSFTANKSNLIKSIDGYSSNEWEWSKADYHRSYWATNTSEDIKIKSWNELSAAKTDASEKYIQENTLGTWVNGNDNQKTSTYVMVAATLKKGNEEINALVALDGLYYLEDDGKVAVANKAFRAEGDDNVKTTEGKQLEAAHLEFVTSATEKKAAGDNIKAYQTYAKLSKAGETAVGEANVAKANKALQKITVKYWNGGKCYYFKQIQHNETPLLYGVVRNHVYDLSLDAIGGLGTPVVDPTDPIIPEIPDDDPTKWYLSARVNVLQWRIVPTQKITWE